MTMFNGGYNRPSIVPFIPVSSENEARNYYVQPGGTSMFMNTTNPEIYSKSVDYTGQNATFDVYDMVKREPKPIPSSQPSTLASMSKDDLSSMISDIIDQKLSDKRFNRQNKYKTDHTKEVTPTNG